MEFISIDCSPSDENCIQVEKGVDYMPAMRAEAERYLSMLRLRFPNCDRVSFSIAENRHDFGLYLDIHIEYEYDDEEGEAQMLFIEGHLPEKWTDTEVIAYKE